MHKTEVGVNILGDFTGISGVSVATRANLIALRVAGVNVSVTTSNISEGPKCGAEKTVNQHDSRLNPYPINLIHANCDFTSLYLEAMPAKFFEDKYNIGVWAWEFSDPPDQIERFFSVLNEVWVPSYFCVDALMKVSNIPIVRFLHPIQFSDTNITRKELKLPEDKFIFLNVFDFLSFVERKNPQAIIKSFLLAFGHSNDNVALVFKTINSGSFKRQIKELKDLAIGHNNILFIDDTLENSHMTGLYKNCDAYISLHRSEGFGLTMAEAMYYGKPTIATGYSGNTDFMNVTNSYLVNYKLVKVDFDLLGSNHCWADPDIYDAADKMKEVYTTYSNALAKGAKAAEYIRQYLSPEAIGNQMKNRLDIINKGLVNNNQIQISDSISVLNENFLLKKRISSLEKSISNRIIDGLNYILRRLVG